MTLDNGKWYDRKTTPFHRVWVGVISLNLGFHAISLRTRDNMATQSKATKDDENARKTMKMCA